MAHRSVFMPALLALMTTGCSTIDWKAAGEGWRESLCREELKSPCPDPNDPDDPTIDPF